MLCITLRQRSQLRKILEFFSIAAAACVSSVSSYKTSKSKASNCDTCWQVLHHLREVSLPHQIWLVLQAWIDAEVELQWQDIHAQYASATSGHQIFADQTSDPRLASTKIPSVRVLSVKNPNIIQLHVTSSQVEAED